MTPHLGIHKKQHSTWQAINVGGGKLVGGLVKLAIAVVAVVALFMAGLSLLSKDPGTANAISDALNAEPTPCAPGWVHVHPPTRGICHQVRKTKQRWRTLDLAVTSLDRDLGPSVFAVEVTKGDAVLCQTIASIVRGLEKGETIVLPVTCVENVRKFDAVAVRVVSGG
jgi:hypothetical protein